MPLRRSSRAEIVRRAAGSGSGNRVRLFIVGTGTDVGKTHVSACLLLEARRRGVVARAYKPVATGVDDVCEDAARHAAALDAPVVPPTFSYRRPVSPHLAAREERRPVELPRIAARADELAGGAELLLIESAGGLFSPLGDGETNATLALLLSPALVVLVAADRLGVLHDVRACRLAARSVGVRIDALVLSAPPAADASTGENGRELEALGLGPVAGAFPRASVDADATRAVAAQVWTALYRASSP